MFVGGSRYLPTSIKIRLSISSQVIDTVFRAQSKIRGGTVKYLVLFEILSKHRWFTTHKKLDLNLKKALTIFVSCLFEKRIKGQRPIEKRSSAMDAIESLRPPMSLMEDKGN